MATKEEIKSEIEKVPDARLAELYQVVKAFTESKPASSKPTLFSKLRRIRISDAALLNTKEDVDSICAFDEAKSSGDEAIPFSQAVKEIEGSASYEKFDLAELVSRMPSDYKVSEEDFGEPVGKEEW